jgi:hypothetical protein
MNNGHPSPTTPNISGTLSSEPERIQMRARLQDVFGELRLVRDVITVSVEAMHAQVSDFDPEVGRVLFQCGAERLYGQLESISDLIEQLGGRTEFTEDRDRVRATQERGVTHVGA